MASASTARGVSIVRPVLIAAALVGCVIDVAAASKVYFTEKIPARVRRSDLDGTNVESIATGLSNPLTVSVAGGKVYWVDNGTGKVERANLDGSGREDVATAVTNAAGVDVDAAGGWVYWTAEGKIRRAELDGSNAIDLVTGIGRPFDVKIDVAGGKIYWTEGTTELVRRANLADGTGVETLVDSSETSGPFGLDLDVAAAKMYWVSQGAGPRQVQRANLDGSVVESVIGGTDPQTVVLDPVADWVYYTDQGVQKIRRVHRDGTGAMDVISGLTFPSGVDLLPGPDAYFLVVPRTVESEGSYGTDSGGGQRPPAQRRARRSG